jgi:transcriptional regulator with XRE-family HTH domain
VCASHDAGKPEGRVIMKTNNLQIKNGIEPVRTDDSATHVTQQHHNVPSGHTGQSIHVNGHAAVNGHTVANPTVVVNVYAATQPAIAPDVVETNGYIRLWHSGSDSETLRRALFADFLKEVRLDLDMNREELSKIAGIAREKIRDIEHGKLPLSQISIGDLGALAGALGPDTRRMLLWLAGKPLALAGPVQDEVAENNDKEEMPLLSNGARIARFLEPQNGLAD